MITPKKQEPPAVIPALDLDPVLASFRADLFQFLSAIAGGAAPGAAAPGAAPGAAFSTRIIFTWFGTSGSNSFVWTADTNYWFRGVISTSGSVLTVTTDGSDTTQVAGSSHQKTDGVLWAQNGVLQGNGPAIRVRIPAGTKVTIQSAATGILCMMFFELDLDHVV